VDDPPVEEVELRPPVEVLTPPVDVLTPPVEPLVVDEITTVLPLPPPPLPPKKPPKKPPLPVPLPPLLPLPVVTMGKPEPPDVPDISIGARTNAAGSAGGWIANRGGGSLVRVLLATRCTGAFRAFTVLAGVIGLRLTICTLAGRAVSASWSAPPPTIAPPQANAHNFARAILTDMMQALFQVYVAEVTGSQKVILPVTQNKPLTSTPLTEILSILWAVNYVYPREKVR